MTIVSNASPLIALIRIGQLDLLRQLYSEILIPEAVWHEVVVEGADQPGGEAEAIALAVEMDAPLLLMDERLGRDTARHFGMRYTGVVGVLIEAKRKGIVQAIQPHLDALRDLAGFRVSEALYRRVLQDEGEI
jgi:uncharacterized protein